MKSRPRAAPYHVPNPSISAFPIGIPAASTTAVFPDQPRLERKLFVGMLSKECSEMVVRSMFKQFGHIEECKILRDNAGQSKGCAFVTFLTHQSALNAIKAMHHSVHMSNCTSPLVVKFAEGRNQKILQQLPTNLWAGSNALSQNSYITTLGQQLGTADSQSYFTASQLQLMQQLQNSGQTHLGPRLLQNSIALPNLLVPNSSTANLGEGIYLGLQLLQNSQGLLNLSMQNRSTANLGEMNSANLLQNSQGLLNLSMLNRSTANLGEMNSTNVLQNSHGLLNLSMPNISTANLGKRTYLGPQLLQNSQGLLNLSMPNRSTANLGEMNPATLQGVPLTYTSNVTVTKHHHQTQCVGPDGANLFVHNMPGYFNDSKLAETFSLFGTVISAKVIIDKETNMSKRFGFVSYDNILSAQAAIKYMNGLYLGTKKLRVELKQKKDHSSVTKSH